MALQMSIQAADMPFGIAVPEAYIRIGRVEFDHEVLTNRAVVTVSFYASRLAYVNKHQPFKTLRLPKDAIDHAALDNIKTLLYEWLKTLPEFASATDALE